MPITTDELAAQAAAHGVTPSQVASAPRQSSGRRKGKCRYFATKKGKRCFRVYVVAEGGAVVLDPDGIEQVHVFRVPAPQTCMHVV